MECIESRRTCLNKTVVCTILLATCLFGIYTLSVLSRFYYTILILIAIMFVTLTRIFCKCRITGCRHSYCCACKTYRCMSHFVVYFGITFLIMDMVQMKTVSQILLIVITATIACYVETISHRQQKRECFECFNVITLFVVFLLALCQNNYYAILAGYLNGFLNYCMISLKNRKNAKALQTRRIFILIFFVIFAIKTILVQEEQYCDFNKNKFFYTFTELIYNCFRKFVICVQLISKFFYHYKVSKRCNVFVKVCRKCGRSLQNYLRSEDCQNTMQQAKKCACKIGEKCYCHIYQKLLLLLSMGKQYFCKRFPQYAEFVKEFKSNYYKPKISIVCNELN